MDLCDECKYHDVLSPSVCWCYNCDERLCIVCKDHHSKRKSSRNHHLLEISDYWRVSSIGRSGCEEHREPFDFYCIDDDKPICIKCTLTSHRTCGTIKPLAEVFDMKFSELRSRMNEKLEALSFNINMATVNVLNNGYTIKEKIKTIGKEIKRGIEVAFHKIEKECIQELYAYLSKCSAAANYLSHADSEVTQLQQNYLRRTSGQHSLASFLELKEVEIQIDNQESTFQKKIFENKMNIINIHLKFDPETIKNAVFSTETIQSSFQIPGCQRAQTTLGIKKHKIKEFDLSAADLHDVEVRGCAIVNNNMVCFADRDNNRLLFMSTAGLQKEIRLEDSPMDIALMNDSKLAVSLLKNKSIQIFNTKFWQWEKFLFSDYTGLSGLAVSDNKILARVGGQGYYLITLDAQLDLAIERKGSNMPYVASFNDRIYATKWDTHEVFCLDKTGKLLWTFKDELRLKNPNGVTTDNNERVYVAGTGSNNVVVISADGKHSTEIVCSNDNIRNPITIDYDKTNNLLLVSSANRTSLLFSIT